MTDRLRAMPRSPVPEPDNQLRSPYFSEHLFMQISQSHDPPNDTREGERHFLGRLMTVTVHGRSEDVAPIAELVGEYLHPRNERTKTLTQDYLSELSRVDGPQERAVPYAPITAGELAESVAVMRRGWSRARLPQDATGENLEPDGEGSLTERSPAAKPSLFFTGQRIMAYGMPGTVTGFGTNAPDGSVFVLAQMDNNAPNNVTRWHHSNLTTAPLDEFGTSRDEKSNVPNNEADTRGALWHTCPPETTTAQTRHISKGTAESSEQAWAEAIRDALPPNPHAFECLDSLLGSIAIERERAEQVVKENAIMRGLLAHQKPCHYCGAETMAKCPRGFPGCALADDLLIADDVMLTDETILRLKTNRDVALSRAANAEQIAYEREYERDVANSGMRTWQEIGVRNLAHADRAEREVARLREALDWIEAEPEDPIKVQLRARAALAPSVPVADKTEQA